MVYLIHFAEAYRHARHYLGWTEDLPRRLEEHASGNGAWLMEVVTDAGIEWEVVRTWVGGRELECRLKRWNSGVKLCPRCLFGRARQLRLFVEVDHGNG